MLNQTANNTLQMLICWCSLSAYDFNINLQQFISDTGGSWHIWIDAPPNKVPAVERSVASKAAEIAAAGNIPFMLIAVMMYV